MKTVNQIDGTLYLYIPKMKDFTKKKVLKQYLSTLHEGWFYFKTSKGMTSVRIRNIGQLGIVLNKLLTGDISGFRVMRSPIDGCLGTEAELSRSLKITIQTLLNPIPAKPQAIGCVRFHGVSDGLDTTEIEYFSNVFELQDSLCRAYTKEVEKRLRCLSV